MTFLNRERNLGSLGQPVTYKMILLLVIGWLCLSIIQTIHFYWYFKQTLWNSVRWSFRDWFVWFVMFGCLFSVFANQARFTQLSIRNVLIIAVIAIACGFLQTFIVVSIDYVIGTPSRPFWDDFWRFYSKRWLQHLFVFTIFWLLMLNRSLTSPSETTVNCEKGTSESTSDENTQRPTNERVQKIQVSDGKSNQWIEQEDIFCVEAAGNYICFHTVEGQLISRDSLKHIEKMLDQTNFIRVSRSNIVNVNKIQSSHRVNRSKVELTLANDHTVTIGPTYWRDIKTRLNL
ncbi:LytR/AlgR family response regulator transcription factor [Agarilytica rhodophyticola]|uniref:LytR/AlgR family response regulator transcription factor n=1 Tax=Agarilytica rhodophyticola TaxID=1737490 RepID=UPI000B344C19|nr:LytTR family DNA-binding domain-containing protein [Agarilytica rhodophyticola]